MLIEGLYFSKGSSIVLGDKTYLTPTAISNSEITEQVDVNRIFKELLGEHKQVSYALGLIGTLLLKGELFHETMEGAYGLSKIVKLPPLLFRTTKEDYLYPVLEWY